MVDSNVGRALRGELGGSDGEHIGPTTETVGDQQDVRVASRRDRKRAEVVDADGDARTFWERMKVIGQRTVSRGVFRAWRFKQWRSHHRVYTFMPIHQ